jgi:hypothetical protein
MTLKNQGKNLSRGWKDSGGFMEEVGPEVDMNVQVALLSQVAREDF